MLDRHGHGIRCLDAGSYAPRQGTSQQRVLAVRLKVAPAERVAVSVDRGRDQAVRALSRGLFGEGDTIVIRNVAVKRRSDAPGGWEAGDVGAAIEADAAGAVGAVGQRDRGDIFLWDGSGALDRSSSEERNFPQV